MEMHGSTYIVIEQTELYERCAIYEPHFMHFGNSITYLSVSDIHFPIGKLGVAHRAPISGSHSGAWQGGSVAWKKRLSLWRQMGCKPQSASHQLGWSLYLLGLIFTSS